MSETNETRIGELLESAVPPLPERPDRITEVGTRVRRTRLAMGGVAASAVAFAVALAVAVPAVLTGADRAAPGPFGPSENLSCPSAIDVRDWTAPTPPAEPQGDPLAPQGAVGAMLCEREVIDPGRGLRGEVIYAPVLTTNVDQVGEALNLPPVEWGGPSNVCFDDAPPNPPSQTRWLVLSYPTGEAITVTWDDWCGAWSTGGQVRFRDEVSDVFYRLYAVQAGLSPPPSGAPTFTEPAEVVVGETYRLTLYTHCGLAGLPFDGRYWSPKEVAAYTQDYVTADVTYVDHDTLRLTLVAGLGAGRVFVLHPGEPVPCD